MTSALDLFTTDTAAGAGVADGPRRVRVAGDLFHGRVPDEAVYVGRGAPGLRASRYANPHKVGACRACGKRHDQAGAVAAYARYLDGRPDLVAAARQELAGKDLACWCRTGLPCHADVLLARLTRAPRVWLASDHADQAAPVDRPVVRDHLMRQWKPAADNTYRTADGRHHASWGELRSRFDLVEDTAAPAPTGAGRRGGAPA
jgi:hypothetical protein